MLYIRFTLHCMKKIKKPRHFVFKKAYFYNNKESKGRMNATPFQLLNTHQ